MEQQNELFGALAKAHAEFPEIKKDKEVYVKTKKGSNYTFNYATLGNLIKATKPALSKHGLSVIQVVGNEGVYTILTHSSGQHLQTPMFDLGGFPEDDPQGVGSLITYAKRYQYAALLSLDADEDDDANIASGNEVQQKTAPVVEKPKPKKAPTKKKKAPAETAKEIVDEDYEKQIANITDKNDLIEWWKQITDSDPEARGKYQQIVLKRLQEL